MKIAYLTTQYPKTSHTFIRRELRELERRGHSVLRLAIRRPEEAAVDALDREEAAKTIHCLAQPRSQLLGAFAISLLSSPWRLLRALGAALRTWSNSHRSLVTHLAYVVEAAFLARLLAKEGIEHVHVHFGTNPAVVMRLVKILGGPGFSVTYHGPAEFDAPIAFDVARSVSESAFAVAISSYGSAQLCRWVPERYWERIHVVRCGIDDAYRERPTSIDADCRRFVCVGRLSAQKGHFVLLDAAAELAASGVDFELVLVGGGELKADLERRARQLDLDGRVRFEGWADDASVRAWLARSRCFVLPSFAEGLPVTILEALALGRPVISTYVAGIPEVVRPGETGWLIPAGDRRALAHAMSEALREPVARLNQMGASGRELVSKLHHLPTEVTKLEAHVEEAVARGRGGTPADGEGR